VSSGTVQEGSQEPVRVLGRLYIMMGSAMEPLQWGPAYQAGFDTPPPQFLFVLWGLPRCLKEAGPVANDAPEVRAACALSLIRQGNVNFTRTTSDFWSNAQKNTGHRKTRYTALVSRSIIEPCVGGQPKVCQGLGQALHHDGQVYQLPCAMQLTSKLIRGTGTRGTSGTSGTCGT